MLSKLSFFYPNRYSIYAHSNTPTLQHSNTIHASELIKFNILCVVGHTITQQYFFPILFLLRTSIHLIAINHSTAPVPVALQYKTDHVEVIKKTSSLSDQKITMQYFSCDVAALPFSLVLFVLTRLYRQCN